MSATNDAEQTLQQKRLPTLITAEEALEILQSAVNYCQLAGLTIRAGNVPNLCLSIEGVVMDSNPPRFRLAQAAGDMTAQDSTPPAVRPIRSRL